MIQRILEGALYCTKINEDFGYGDKSSVQIVEKILNNLPSFTFTKDSVIDTTVAKQSLVVQNNLTDLQIAKLSEIVDNASLFDFINREGLRLKVKPNVVQNLSKIIENELPIGCPAQVASTAILQFQNRKFDVTLSEILTACVNGEPTPAFEASLAEIIESVCGTSEPISRAESPTNYPILNDPSGIVKDFENTLQASFATTNVEEAQVCLAELTNLTNIISQRTNVYKEALSLIDEVEQRFFYLDILNSYTTTRKEVYDRFFENLSTINSSIAQKKQEANGLRNKISGALSKLSGNILSKERDAIQNIVDKYQSQLRVVESEIVDLKKNAQSLKNREVVFNDSRFDTTVNVINATLPKNIPAVDILTAEFQKLKQSFEVEFSSRVSLSWEDFSFRFNIDEDKVPKFGSLKTYYDQIQNIDLSEATRSSESFISDFKDKQRKLKNELVIAKYTSVKEQFKAFGELEAKVAVRAIVLDNNASTILENNPILSGIKNFTNLYNKIREEWLSVKTQYDNLISVIESFEGLESEVAQIISTSKCFSQTPLQYPKEVLEAFTDSPLERPYPDYNEPSQFDLTYWQQFANNLTVASVLNPLSWATGLLIPTPSGLLKVPVPTIWRALSVIKLPFNLGIWVLFIGLNGILPCPFLYEINYYEEGTSRFRIGLRAVNKLIKTKANIDIDKVRTYTPENLKIPAINVCEGFSFFKHPNLDVSELLSKTLFEVNKPSNFEGIIPKVWSLLTPSILPISLYALMAMNLSPEKSIKIPFIREDIPSWTRLPKGMPLKNPIHSVYLFSMVRDAQDLTGFETPPTPLPYF